MTGQTSLAGRSILVVEDDYFLAFDLAHALSRHGARVLGPVATVDDALALIGASPDLDGAVLDLNLQGQMVYPVADLLRGRRIPFIFATGYDREAVAGYDAVGWCKKPVAPMALARMLFGTAGRETCGAG